MRHALRAAYPSPTLACVLTSIADVPCPARRGVAGQGTEEEEEGGGAPGDAAGFGGMLVRGRASRLTGKPVVGTAPPRTLGRGGGMWGGVVGRN